MLHIRTLLAFGEVGGRGIVRERVMIHASSRKVLALVGESVWDVGATYIS